jgi:glycosyltransferase involved in cell wall biosynthesis
VIPAEPTVPADPQPLSGIRGYVDVATRERVSGWAYDTAAPQTRVALLITANDKLLARVLADRSRPDLRDAGFGDGSCGFDLEIKGLSPFEVYVIAVRRETDMAHLDRSPMLLEKLQQFDPAFRAQVAAVLADVPDDAALTERIAFLADQTEALLQLRAHRRTRPAEREALRQIKWRWAKPGASNAPPRPEPLLPRALVIDDYVPLPSRDAGSNAVLSHMHALQRLGFEVSFAATDMARDPSGALDDAGILTCHAPWHGSVEEVLRREAHSFDLVYLHRATVASSYMALVRRTQPKARLLYSVADLHHLRLARQANAEDRPELMDLARRFQLVELRAAASADVTITHSTHEAALLRKQLGAAQIHVIPWAVPSLPTAIPFAQRHGLAFIGHYGHAPNADAARWLVDTILPGVHAIDPALPCLLAGSTMPDDLRQARPGVEPIGQVDALSAVFDRVRLTVAPMQFGAGIKGKVLESLAHGVPCVCTPIAAEGLDLPPALHPLVAADPAGLVAIIMRLHTDEAFNTACRDAGLAYVAANLTDARIDALMRQAAGLPVDRATRLGADPG